jgi:endoglucanase
MALLLAYERHPDLFKNINTNIPESGNGTPDILNECRWGLRWVLCMQDESGGFRARDSAYDFSPMGPADKDKKVRWVAGIGTASTAKACAALALAARVYAPFDAAFAKQCGDAALKGWDFLQKHSEHMVVDGHKSKEPLWDDGPTMPEEAGSRLAASVEMWKTFRTENYLKAAQGYLTQPQTQPTNFLRSSWVNIARWPVIELAEDDQTPAAIKADCVDRIKRAAEEALNTIKNDGYNCSLGLESYVWSCNILPMEEALMLAEYAKLDPTQVEAKEAARDQWHWILGRNPNGYSMITGVGKAPTALYHCEWQRVPVLPPGYLEGGPNSYQAHFLAPNAPAKCLLWDNPTALSSGAPAHQLWHSEQKDLWDGGFVPKDQWTVGWYVVTEPDINGNADLVLAEAEFQE